MVKKIISLVKDSAEKASIKNMLFLLSGNTIAQLLPILMSPILTRIYSPSDFGVLSIYVSLCNILSSIGSGRYEMAIVLPKSAQEKFYVSVLSLLISLSISVLLLLIVIVFDEEIINYFGATDNNLWVYAIPISVFMTASYNVLRYYSISIKQFKVIALSITIRAISGSLLQVVAGLAGMRSKGLILSQLLSLFFSNSKVWQIFKNEASGYANTFSYKRLKLFAIKYRKFPIYSLPSVFANTITQQGTNLFISNFYNTYFLGQFSMVNRVLAIPLVMVGNAVGDVFFQQANEEKLKTGGAKKSITKMIVGLAIISLVIFMPLYFIIEQLFEIVFGKEWRIAGTYAKIMIPLFATRLISSPISIVVSIFNKQQVSLYMNLLLLLTSVSVFYLSAEQSLNVTLYRLTISLSIEYIIFIFYYYYLSVKHSNHYAH